MVEDGAADGDGEPARKRAKIPHATGRVDTALREASPTVASFNSASHLPREAKPASSSSTSTSTESSHTRSVNHEPENVARTAVPVRPAQRKRGRRGRRGGRNRNKTTKQESTHRRCSELVPRRPASVRANDVAAPQWEDQREKASGHAALQASDRASHKKLVYIYGGVPRDKCARSVHVNRPFFRSFRPGQLGVSPAYTVTPSCIIADRQTIVNYNLEATIITASIASDDPATHQQPTLTARSATHVQTSANTNANTSANTSANARANVSNLPHGQASSHAPLMQPQYGTSVHLNSMPKKAAEFSHKFQPSQRRTALRESAATPAANREDANLEMNGVHHIYAASRKQKRKSRGRLKKQFHPNNGRGRAPRNATQNDDRDGDDGGALQCHEISRLGPSTALHDAKDTVLMPSTETLPPQKSPYLFAHYPTAAPTTENSPIITHSTSDKVMETGSDDEFEHSLSSLATAGASVRTTKHTYELQQPTPAEKEEEEEEEEEEEAPVEAKNRLQQQLVQTTTGLITPAPKEPEAPEGTSHERRAAKPKKGRRKRQGRAKKTKALPGSGPPSCPDANAPKLHQQTAPNSTSSSPCESEGKAQSNQDSSSLLQILRDDLACHLKPPKPVGKLQQRPAQPDEQAMASRVETGANTPAGINTPLHFLSAPSSPPASLFPRTAALPSSSHQLQDEDLNENSHHHTNLHEAPIGGERDPSVSDANSAAHLLPDERVCGDAAMKPFLSSSDVDPTSASFQQPGPTNQTVPESGILRATAMSSQQRQENKGSDANRKRRKKTRPVPPTFVSPYADARLAALEPALFSGKRVLEIGCNTGSTAIEIARRLSPLSVRAIDRDKVLIRRARRKLASIASECDGQFCTGLVKTYGPITYAPTDGSHACVPPPTISESVKSKLQAFFAGLESRHERARKQETRRRNRAKSKASASEMCESDDDSDDDNGGCKHNKSDGREGDNDSRTAASAGAVPKFPANIAFETVNIVEGLEGLHRVLANLFDTILCLNVTKFIHLTYGDDGIRKLFSMLYLMLRPGGRLVLEPQPWESYRQSRMRLPLYLYHAKRITLRPATFLQHLISLGFELESQHTVLEGRRCQKRPLLVLRKHKHKNNQQQLQQQQPQDSSC